MAQLGLHAIVGVFLISLVPFFLPFNKRRAFVYGLFWGCIFPDLDTFVQAALFLYNRQLADRMHRTFLHSLITSTAIFIVLQIIHQIQVWRHKKSSRNQTRANIEYDKFNTGAFGAGLWFGIASHCLLDTLFWFSPIELLWPLEMFDIVDPANIWQHIQIAPMFEKFMTASEMLVNGIFFTYLRLFVASKFDISLFNFCTKKTRGSSSYDSASTFALRERILSDSYSVYDGHMLAKVRKILSGLFVVEALHYLYFVAVFAVVFLGSFELLFMMTFVPQLFVTVPCIYVFAYLLRHSISWEQEKQMLRILDRRPSLLGNNDESQQSLMIQENV